MMDASINDHGEIALSRAEAIPVLYARHPLRSQLLSLQTKWPVRSVRVRVHRNLACELVTSVAAPYLTFAGLSAEWRYGDYDDSLSFPDDGNAADVELVWLDYSRFTADNARTLGEWVVSRLMTLRARVTTPILITGDPRRLQFSEELNATVSSLAPDGVYMCDLRELVEEMGDAFFDSRNLKLAGLPYSNGGAILAARRLGARWLPAAVGVDIRAITVDLDNTLYEGVLGEDGTQGVRIAPAHLELQKQLLTLKDQGVFIAICSKNDPADVEALFDTRSDLLLQRSDISSAAIGWESKASGLRQIAAELRIAPVNMLFVDDNPGELAEVASVLPDLKLLHAGGDPSITAGALRDYPGLHRWRTSAADRLRIADLTAAHARAKDVLLSSDPHAYRRSLQSRITFRIDQRVDTDRLAELSRKTNQFNVRLRRFGAVDVAAYADRNDFHAVAVELSDRLSDSGVIAAVFTQRVGNECSVDEVCISCRALGRELEDLIVLGAVRATLESGDGVASVKFAFAEGPRNAPARKWLETLTGRTLASEDTAVVPWSSCLQRLARFDDEVVPDRRPTLR